MKQRPPWEENEKQVNEDTKDFEIIISTDGSYKGRTIAWGLARWQYKKIREELQGALSGSKSSEAENWGFGAALKIATKLKAPKSKPNAKIAILTDSRSLVDLLKRGNVVRDEWESLIVNLRDRLTVAYVPAHCGISYNVTADQLAKTARKILESDESLDKYWAQTEYHFNDKKDVMLTQRDTKILDKDPGMKIKKILRNTWTQHNNGGTQHDDRGTQLNDGSTQLNDGGTQLNDGGTQLNDGDAQHNDGDAQHNDGGTQLNDGGTQHNNGDTQLNDGDTQHNDGGTQHNDGDTQHNDRNTQHDNGDTQHDNGDMQHDNGDMQHSDGDMQHNDGDMQHNNGDTQLDNRGTQHSDGDTQHSDGDTQHSDGDTQQSDGDTQHNDGDTQHNNGDTQHNNGDTQHNDGDTSVREENVWHMDWIKKFCINTDIANGRSSEGTVTTSAVAVWDQRDNKLRFERWQAQRNCYSDGNAEACTAFGNALEWAAKTTRPADSVNILTSSLPLIEELEQRKIEEKWEKAIETLGKRLTVTYVQQQIGVSSNEIEDYRIAQKARNLLESDDSIYKYWAVTQHNYVKKN